jgi:hypothetical protein
MPLAIDMSVTAAARSFAATRQTVFHWRRALADKSPSHGRPRARGVLGQPHPAEEAGARQAPASCHTFRRVCSP